MCSVKRRCSVAYCKTLGERIPILIAAAGTVRSCHQQRVEEIISLCEDVEYFLKPGQELFLNVRVIE
jgi:hypothetical protein